MKNNKYLLSVEVPVSAEFYDVDSMGVVWHGNYVKFMEVARCALLDKIGYGYKVMMQEGYAFPVMTINVKYVRSLYFGEKAVIRAHLVEYENILRIQYEVINSEGKIATKAESTQIAVKWDTKETLFEAPELFIKRCEDAIKNNK